MATLNPGSPAPGALLPLARPAANANAPAGILGELVVSEALPRYYSMVKSGIVFAVAALAVNPTAFIGAAAGTPLIGIYNPAGSGKDIVLIGASLGIRTTGTAAATLDFNWFGVNQGGVAVTGTQTQASNLYSQAATGSVAYAMVNTANTAALASTLRRSSFSVGNVGATAGLNAAEFYDDIGGLLVISPGCYLALGASATLTAASIDAVVKWAEVPV
ncbi:MAG: hypothetical protein ACLPN5_23555 [Roseiarcus sp.]